MRDYCATAVLSEYDRTGKFRWWGFGWSMCVSDPHLSLDDVEKKVRVTAATEEVTEAQGLVETFDLLLNLRRRSSRWTPKAKQHLWCSWSPPMWWSLCRTLLESYCGSRLVSWDSSKLLLSVIVCLVEAAARWLSKAKISCFSLWEIWSSLLIISVFVSSSVMVHGGNV